MTSVLERAAEFAARIQYVGGGHPDPPEPEEVEAAERHNQDLFASAIKEAEAALRVALTRQAEIAAEAFFARRWTEQWYAERHARLLAWGREQGHPEIGNILANGTADVREPPTYAQQLAEAIHRRENAEEEVRRLQQELLESLGAHEKSIRELARPCSVPGDEVSERTPGSGDGETVGDASEKSLVSEPSATPSLDEIDRQVAVRVMGHEWLVDEHGRNALVPRPEAIRKTAMSPNWKLGFNPDGPKHGYPVPKFSTRAGDCAAVKNRLRAAGIPFNISFDPSGNEVTVGDSWTDEYVWVKTEELAVCLFALKCAEAGRL